MKMKFDVHVVVGILAVSSAFAVISNTAAVGHTNLYSKVAQTDTATQKVAFEVSKQYKVVCAVKNLKHYAKARKQLNKHELHDLLQMVGFRGEKLKQAWAIAMRESNGRPLAHNTNTNTGDNSYGIFQINMIGDLGPHRRDKFELKSNNELFNPVVNAKIAFYMSDGGRNWSSWGGINIKDRDIMKHYPA